MGSLVESSHMANPYQRAIFVLREISKIQSHNVPIRIFKMHKIIVDYEFKDVYQECFEYFIYYL